MNFQLLCKSIGARVVKELASAKSQEEKALILTIALYGYGDTVLKSLRELSQEAGADSPRYKQAQTAASELLTFLVLPFISSCSTYKQGITVLGDLGEACPDEALRRRLVIYANQIKKRWNKADPVGLPINPRTAQNRPEKTATHFIANGIRLTMFFGAVLFFLTRVDLTSLVFPHWKNSSQQTPEPQVRASRLEDVAPPENQAPVPPAEAPAQQAPAASGDFFSYTDSKGVIHLGNDLQNVPPQLRKRVTVTRSAAPRSDLTPVAIKGNQVFVPVTLSYRGRSVQASLLLDTGASVTTISERLAARLGVDPMDTRPGTATVADGRTIGSRSFVADSLVVGPRSLPQLRTSILPGSGGAEHDGLLGMDFMKNVRYHVNFSRNVIEWSSR
ncbi:MAG: retroviral-like aspartic protease family protein [Verrucomicrobia bacterium]|nr:retroviral-like aspartic protease family protein [Deltaproteobacteria bacterium]